MTIRNILAVGGGAMGSQPAFYYAMHGYDVVQYDISKKALAACREYHQRYVEPFQVVFPTMTDEDIHAGLARIRYSADLADAAKDADLVTESVPEVLEVKRQVWADLGRLCPDHTIFTTNTSTLAPGTIADATGRPGRFLALHYAMGIWDSPIAEVMKHPGTENAAFEQVLEFVEEARLVPIRLEKEQPGYVINTLLVPWLQGALELVVNDICSFQDVDRTWMICSQGMPMGPIGVIDQVGFEVCRNIQRLKTAADPDNPQYQKNIDDLERNFLDKGYQGALGGKGFYDYPDPEYSRPDFLGN